jgi:hypothetical protein
VALAQLTQEAVEVLHIKEHKEAAALAGVAQAVEKAHK